MSSATSGTVVSKDGTRIAYAISGSGPTIVIVAGALGYKDFPYLRKFAEEFAKDFRVVTYDRRGRGDSSDTQPYTIDKEIEDLAAVRRGHHAAHAVLEKPPAGRSHASVRRLHHE